MKTIGHLDILGDVSGSFKELADYPENPRIGTWAFIRKSLMLCVSIEDLPVWIPLTQERNTYLFEQPTPSATWLVEHSFGSNNVLIQCFDESNNVVHPSSIKDIDENVSEVVFPDAIIGKAIVMYGYEHGASATGNFLSGGAGNGLGLCHLADFPNRKCITRGYLPLDGQRIFRSDYPDFVDLYAGTEFDYVDLPDANGERLFFRGGADEEHVFGDIQEDAIRNITGSLGKVQLRDATVAKDEGALFAKETFATSYGGSGSHMSVELGFDASRAVDTADENRPVNTSVVKCIKVFDAPQVSGTKLKLDEVLDELLEAKRKSTPVEIAPWDVTNSRHNVEFEAPGGHLWTDFERIEFYLATSQDLNEFLAYNVLPHEHISANPDSWKVLTKYDSSYEVEVTAISETRLIIQETGSSKLGKIIGYLK